MRSAAMWLLGFRILKNDKTDGRHVVIVRLPRWFSDDSAKQDVIRRLTSDAAFVGKQVTTQVGDRLVRLEVVDRDVTK
jgi:hypothetical protein